MDPASWSVTPPLPFDAAWFADVQPLLPTGGYLEGGRLHMLLDTRFCCTMKLWAFGIRDVQPLLPSGGSLEGVQNAA